MLRKLLAVLLAAVMVLSLAACTAPAATPDAGTQEAEAEKGEEAAPEEAEAEEAVAADDFGGITLTFMNSKPEISDEMEAIVKGWADQHNVKIEFYETSNPTDTLTQKYAAGDGPILAVVDSTQIVEMGEEKMLPLDGAEWESETKLGWYVNGKLYGMPLTVESQCLVVNKKAVEETLGREFDKSQYTTTETFEALLAELREKGMENPIIMMSESWSMCGHLFAQMMNFQDGTAQGCFDFVDFIKDGGDAYDNEMTATITNDRDFDSQLLSISEYVFEKNLITETLDEYIDGEFIDMFNHNKNDKNSVPEITNVYYNTKNKFYNINRTFKSLFSFNWDNNSIYNYSLNTTKNEDLINDNIVFIDYIIYSQDQNHEILTETQKKSELADLAELTRKINSIVPVNEAYYKLEENNYINQDLEF